MLKFSFCKLLLFANLSPVISKTTKNLREFIRDTIYKYTTEREPRLGYEIREQNSNLCTIVISLRK